MEATMLTVLNVFAFLGVISAIFYIFRLFKSRTADNDIKLILYLPQNSCSKLEGIIRQIYYEEIPEKFMTDGKVYLMVSPHDAETIRLLERLKRMYPIEVLPEQASYCMITERESY